MTFSFCFSFSVSVEEGREEEKIGGKRAGFLSRYFLFK
jgi:hypothetical protein